MNPSVDGKNRPNEGSSGTDAARHRRPRFSMGSAGSRSLFKDDSLTGLSLIHQDIETLPGRSSDPTASLFERVEPRLQDGKLSFWN
jgi:hypothetical protein